MKLALAVVTMAWLALAGTASAHHINFAAREITLKFVFVGSPASSAAVDSVRYVYSKIDTASKGKLVELSSDDGERMVFFEFVPRDLGELRGFKFRFLVFSTPTAKDFSVARALMIADFDGVVFVADAAPGSAKANVEALADLKGMLSDQAFDYDKQPIVFELVGTKKQGALTVAELKNQLGIGTRPWFEADPMTGTGIFDSLKKIAALVLRDLKDRSDRAIPPVKGATPKP